MSSKSNDKGRAFEYACIINLKNRIDEHRPSVIDYDSTSSAERAWNVQTDETRKTLLLAADAFVDTLFSAEPLILERFDDNDIVVLSINKDADAEGGDIRDIVIERSSIRWNIGLSMKHNHFAVKHSRLSPTIDFGLKWYNVPCSNTYWHTVTPIFEHLKKLREASVTWSAITNKENCVYLPIISAFIDELENAYKADSSVPTKLLSYLLGIRDFYKVVAIDKKRITEFQPFNLRGELNTDGRHNKASLLIPKSELPTEIIALRLKPNSKSTAELYLNNGWSLSFRIHNASTTVEPSLKFDIQLLGMPANIITINCNWN